MPIVNLESRGGLSFGDVFCKIHFSSYVNDMFIVYMRIEQQFRTHIVLDCISIFVSRTRIQKADSVVVQMLVIVEVEGKAVFATLQCFAFGAPEAAIASAVPMELIHAFVACELQKFI